MRIQNRAALWGVGWSATLLMRAWMGSIRAQVVCADPAADPRTAERGYLYAFWHETILLNAYLFRARNIHVLISQSNDGEYIARVVENLGYRAIRGSSARGAVRAVREMARSSTRANLAITPDGPRGPRREFQAGAVYLASRTGLPIVPIGMAYDRPWRASSWDQFVLPRPFSKAACYFGPPLFVPADADAAQLADCQRLAQADLEFSTQQAERLLIGEPLISPPNYASRPAVVSARS